MRRLTAAALTSLTLLGPASCQAPPTAGAAATTREADATGLAREIVSHRADLQLLRRRFDTPMSAKHRDLASNWLREQLAAWDAMPWETLDTAARIDWHCLRDHARRELAAREREAAELQSAAGIVAFAQPLVALCEQRRELLPVDAKTAAATLDTAARSARELTARTDKGEFAALELAVATRTAERLAALQRAVESWFRHHDGYDPQFSWWCRTPWREANEALSGLVASVRRNLVDARSAGSSLPGAPIGEQALLQELAFEHIPYTPAELIAIAEREFAWCDAEMARASAELGFGDDWRRAMEHVKTRHREPGEQPQLVAALAREAIEFLEQRELLTIPPLAREGWRMSMLSPEAQKVNPFFLGGEVIQLSFPTDGMTHGEKLQSLRSNNEHFCRATVHHELIPGHWLQHYMLERHRPERELFESPFWIEGWALHWEMRFYELGLAKTAEDRVGMLYWRKHRCARIVFSLNYHLGNWSARQCIDYLVERVGHEPAAAEGEVRRSIGGTYPPLYQAAYMLGGLQFRALHRELVPQHMTERDFHDRVLRLGALPVSLVRLSLGSEPVPRELQPWRFAEETSTR